MAKKPDREWIKLDATGSMMKDGKQYRNLHTWKGRCALCDVEFILHTPGSKPADQPPTTTTCDEHRGAPKAIEAGWAAWDGKNVVPGKRMKIGAAGATVGVPEAEFDELKKERDEYVQAIMDHLTERGNHVREIADLKARLAKHELGPAMATLIGSTNFCGHGVMAVLCERCNEPAKPFPWKTE